MDLNGLIGPRTGSRINKQLMLLYGSIAKLVIALPCHGRDRGFESRWSRQCNTHALKHPTLYCRPCEAFTSDNDAMIEYGSEFPYGGHLRK